MTSWPPTRWRSGRFGGLRAALVLVALVLGACSPDTAPASDGPASDGLAGAEIEPTQSSSSTDGADVGETASDAPNVDEAGEPETEPDAAPQEYLGRFDAIAVGDCWNDEPDEAGTTLPTVVSCEDRHMHETFAHSEAPWGPNELYPGEGELAQRLADELCNPATIDFAGATTELLPIRTWLWYPSVEEWNAGDRTAMCTIATSSTDREAPFKVGTAAAGTLMTDDAIVARGVVDGASDLYLSRQRSILYRVTDGSHDVALAQPQVLETAMLFTGAPVVDEIAPATLPWLVDYADPTRISSLNVGELGGWEISDAQLVVGASSTVFAARASDDDDWDIYLSANGDDATQLTTNPGDDRWPRVLPDESGVVYNADGRIWMMDLDGGRQRPITDDVAGPDFEPSIAPDGSRIAFTSGRSGNEDIWVVNFDGTGLRNLTEHPSTDAWPFWSLDGERIYWQTDRLGVSSHIMVMTAAGENASYYSVELLTHGAVVPAGPAALLQDSAVPLDGRERLPGEGNFNQIQGEPGELGEFEHSSGRIVVGLPVGWEVVEIDTGRAAQFIAAERIDTFSETWAIDGVMISLIDDNEAVWRSAIASADANRCVEDASDTSLAPAPTGDELEITTIEFTCGQAAAWIVAVRNLTTEAGLLLEAQFDLLPDRAADEAWIIAVSQNIVWG